MMDTRFPPHAARIGAAAAALTALLVGGTVSATTATAAPAAVGGVCCSDLPSRAHDTLDLIEQGGPYPFEQDGTVFQNREGVLPSRSADYCPAYSPARLSLNIYAGQIPCSPAEQTSGAESGP